MAPWHMGLNIDLGCGRTMDLDTVFGSTTVVPGGGKGCPDWYGSSGSVDLGLSKHG